jgi:putative ABC transport system permease protein
MLKLSNITKEYGVGSNKFKALNNINVSFRNSEFVCIVGPSGGGKSTLLNIVGGLDKYSNGDLFINQSSTVHYKESDWDNYRNNSIGFVFQNYNLIPHLTVYDNIILSLSLSRFNRKQRKEKVMNVLDKVGLKSKCKEYPRNLSGGEMQRVAIARAIITDPSIILADEPTGALDSETSMQIMKILKELSKDKLVIMVTHNEKIATLFGTRLIRLIDGKIIEDSNPYQDEKDFRPISKKKASMSIFTAIKFSYKNLITKRFKTILTTMAGSVGIIGVCLVLIFSNIVNVYMEDIQKATLSNYPITIRSTTEETDPLYEDKSFPSFPEGNTINVTNQYRSYYGHVNIFNEAFTSYIKELDPSLYNVVDYKTGIDLKLVTIMDEKYQRVYPYRFTEMSEDVDYLRTQYDVLYGHLPTSKNEIVLLVDRYNNVDVSVLEYLGIDYKNIEKYTFEEISAKEYRLISNNDFYLKNDEGTYRTYRYATELESLYNNSKDTLKISGIIRVSKNATTNLYDNGILYSSELTDYVVQEALKSDIVIDQKKFGLTKDITTGLPFVDEENIYSKITKEYQYETQLADFGAVAKISTIRIFTDKFKSRVQINEYLEAYNQSLGNEDKILYYDYMGNITLEFELFISVLTKVLIVFAAVSLFVSTIMIGIITYISVMERIKEIGILRSLGARRIDVALIFNTETSLIGFASGVIGVISGVLLLKPIIRLITKVLKNNNVTTFDLSKLNINQFDSWYLILLVIGSVFLTIIAGLFPAIIAAYKSPVEAIKTE